MEPCTLSFRVAATGPDLILCVRLDDVVITQQTVSQIPHVIQHQFDDSIERQHVIEFELIGKLPIHTAIDEQGNITADRLLKIDQFSLDGIELGQIFFDLARYDHDSNGTTEPRSERFYGDMGCNGTVSLVFRSPVYLWFLENM